MWNLIATVALAVAAPADVTATKLDGTVVSGRIESWSADQIVLSNKNQTQSLSLADVASLEFVAKSTGDGGRPLVELVDGSVLPIDSYAANDTTAAVRLRGPSEAQGESKSIGVEKVRSVRLQTIEPEVLPQWLEIRKLGLPSDLVVVAKRSGQSLDHLECVLGEVTNSEVAFTLDGQQMRVPRSKVAGLVYYRADETRAEQPPYVIAGPDGLRILASQVHRQESGDLTAATPSGVQVSWPISGVSSVDLSAGKVQFLSDMEPAAVSWQPLVGLPPEASRAAKFGQVRINRSTGGGPLSLTIPDVDPAVGSSQIKAYNQGLVVRSRTELVYRLPAGFQRFLAEAGIEPATAATGNVSLAIYGDDRLLFEHPIDGKDAPLAIDLAVSGVKRLRILVDYGENLDTGDWLNLCNARVVK